MDIATIGIWITTHKVELLEAYLALIGFASIVIRMTPTLADDAWLKKYLKFTGRYIALNKSITATEQKEANSK